ncbi:MAG: GIY-YIG nuclease family protein [Cytophagales bacterium]|nr:GIY-YIG nuclease family protein [Cytophagales bacterium]
MYILYIIYSDKYNVYYKGVTQNLEKRLWEHNNNLSRYTAGKQPWKIVFSQSFASKSEALKEERRIKRRNIASILKLTV